MRRLLSLCAFVAFLFSSSASTMLIDPCAITKTMSPYDLMTGDFGGHPFFDYAIGNEIKFSVILDLVDVVDALIATAKTEGKMLEHVDTDVKWVFEKETVNTFLVLQRTN